MRKYLTNILILLFFGFLGMQGSISSVQAAEYTGPANASATAGISFIDGSNGENGGIVPGPDENDHDGKNPGTNNPGNNIPNYNVPGINDSYPDKTPVKRPSTLSTSYGSNSWLGGMLPQTGSVNDFLSLIGIILILLAGVVYLGDKVRDKRKA